MGLAELIKAVEADLVGATAEYEAKRADVEAVAKNTPAEESPERVLKLAERGVAEGASAKAWANMNHLRVALMLLADVKLHLGLVVR